MSEEPDKDSKTEEPSAKKIRDTIEKGDVPVSRELTNVFSVATLLVVAYFYLPSFAISLTQSLQGILANAGDWPVDTPSNTMNLVAAIMKMVILGLAPVILPLLVAGVVSALVQNQPRMVLNRIAPKFNRISPAKGLERLFGKQTVREFFKSIFKFSAAGMVATVVCLSQMDFVLHQLIVESVRIPASVQQLALQVLTVLVLTIAILGAADLAFVRQDWWDKIKMTRQEVKDEHKQAEGDPHIKMRTRSIARDRARKRMIAQVPTATLVVANPTHFAVAMRYRPLEGDTVPRVLAKGQDLIALKIREIAEEHAVPVIEDKPLARSLYKAVKVDTDLPFEFFVPIARIIRVLMDKERSLKK